MRWQLITAANPPIRPTQRPHSPASRSLPPSPSPFIPILVHLHLPSSFLPSSSSPSARHSPSAHRPSPIRPPVASESDLFPLPGPYTTLQCTTLPPRPLQRTLQVPYRGRPSLIYSSTRARSPSLPATETSSQSSPSPFFRLCQYPQPNGSLYIQRPRHPPSDHTYHHRLPRPPHQSPPSHLPPLALTRPLAHSLLTAHCSLTHCRMRIASWLLLSASPIRLPPSSAPRRSIATHLQLRIAISLPLQPLRDSAYARRRPRTLRDLESTRLPLSSTTSPSSNTINPRSGCASLPRRWTASHRSCGRLRIG